MGTPAVNGMIPMGLPNNAKAMIMTSKKAKELVNDYKDRKEPNNSVEYKCFLCRYWRVFCNRAKKRFGCPSRH
jgi:hypothetical protein